MSDRAKWLLAVLAALGLGYAGGRFAAPTKYVEKVEWKEKEVTRWQTQYASHGEKAERKQTQTTYKPTGEIVVLENWAADTKWADSLQVAGVERHVSEGKSEKVIENAKAWWAVEVGGAWNLSQPTLVPDQYWVQAQIRLIGPLWVGAGAAKTDKWRPMLSARAEFY